mgnify:CR=1 FL=1
MKISDFSDAELCATLQLLRNAIWGSRVAV